METVQLLERYGALKTHHNYSIVAQGADWVSVQHGGSTIYIPQRFIGVAPAIRREREEEREEEGCYD